MSIKFILVGLSIGLFVMAGQVASINAESDATKLFEYVNKFQELRKTMDPKQFELAESFGRAIGNSDLYQWTLGLTSVGITDLDSLEKFQRTRGDLGLVGDADATSKLLVEKKLLQESELTNLEMVHDKLNTILVPACQAYVDTFEKGVYIEAQADQSLGYGLYTYGNNIEVKEFVRNWAHLHICKLFVEGSRAKLEDRIVKRAPERRRIEQKIKTKLGEKFTK